MTATRGKRSLLLALCLLGTLLFTALGIWQVERRAWKLDLIARVNARVNAAPVPLPSRERWAALGGPQAEYRHVQVRGTFLHEKETLVDALTELGPGAWVLTPLRTSDGFILVSRGFVPPQLEEQATRLAGQLRGEVRVTGLLRLSEPHGRFLRPNQPQQDRWFSRDVAAIAHARGLPDVAPFFIDADATPNPGGYPIGGLTVIRFRNTHLLYALTWFGLAALCVTGLVLIRKPAQELG